MVENHLHDAESRDPLQKAWYVYLLQCADGTLYTGISTDVARRLQQHNAGRGARYTRGRGPVELLATIECRDHTDALRLEYRFKKMMPGARLKAFGLLDAFK